MKTSSVNDQLRIRAGGAVEVTIVLGCVALLVVLATTGVITVTKPQSARTRCMHNLKQIGLAALQWSADHGDDNLVVFPWTVSMRSNGVREIATSGNVAALFRAM